jgi:Na+/H+ antiporter NhaA
MSSSPRTNRLGFVGRHPTALRVLLGCGVASSVLYVATDIIAFLSYAGYSFLDQNYSEMVAEGAPTRPFLVGVAIPYHLLLAAFAVGIWAWAGRSRAARIAVALLLVFAVIDTATAMFFQMDLRGVAATPRGSLHGPLTGVFNLFFLLAMGFGAAVLGRRFRWYSIATIATLAGFGIVTSLQIPQLAAGQPTPWMGLTERIGIYAMMLWVAVFGIALLRAQRAGATGQLATPTERPMLTAQSQPQ